MDWYFARVHYPLVNVSKADLLESFKTGEQRANLWHLAARERVRRTKGSQIRFLANPIWLPEKSTFLCDLCLQKGPINYEAPETVVMTDIPNLSLTPVVYFWDVAKLAVAQHPDSWRSHAFAGLCDHLSLILGAARTMVPESSASSIVIQPMGRPRSFPDFLERVAELRYLNLRMVGPNLEDARLRPLLRGLRDYVKGAVRASAVVEGQSLHPTTDQVVEIDDFLTDGCGRVIARGWCKDTRRIDIFHSERRSEVRRAETEDVDVAKSVAAKNLDAKLREALAVMEGPDVNQEE